MAILDDGQAQLEPLMSKFRVVQKDPIEGIVLHLRKGVDVLNEVHVVMMASLVTILFVSIYATQRIGFI